MADSPVALTPHGACDACDACGGSFPGGRAGCDAAFRALSAAAQQDPHTAARHRLAVDAYCLQHPEPYCRSAKSYAAHLAGLCWGVERGGRPPGYRALQRWLDGASTLRKPPASAGVASFTLADVLRAPPGGARDARTVAWASRVWEAHAPHHGLARAWLRQALREDGDARR